MTGSLGVPWMAALVLPLVAEQAQTPPQGRALLELVDALIQQRPFTVAGVEKQTGLNLSLANQNSYWLFYESDLDQNRPVAFVDLRVHAPGSTARAGHLLYLKLGDDHCLPLDEVFERHGRDHNPRVPPHPGRPVGYVFERPWGTISFGAVDFGADCVISVSLKLAGVGR